MLTTVINGKTVHILDSERTECEVWDRPMGYFRPVSEFNIGKKREHYDRKRYKLNLQPHFAEENHE